MLPWIYCFQYKRNRWTELPQFLFAHTKKIAADRSFLFVKRINEHTDVGHSFSIRSQGENFQIRWTKHSKDKRSHRWSADQPETDDVKMFGKCFHFFVFICYFLFVSELAKNDQGIFYIKSVHTQICFILRQQIFVNFAFVQMYMYIVPRMLQLKFEIA